MRMLSLVASLLVALVACPGCRGRSRGTAAGDAKGVGFELPDAAHVEGGAIVTKPSGREEAFLAFVAAGAPGWVDACLGEAGGQAPMFGFETDDKGRLRNLSPEVGKTARERCLSARAIASNTSALPGLTTVRVQLGLRSQAAAR